MKHKLITVACSIALFASLSGCVSYGQTGVLVTPIGVAGIHSFAPPKKSPDNISDSEREAARIAKAME